MNYLRNVNPDGTINMLHRSNRNNAELYGIAADQLDDRGRHDEADRMRAKGEVLAYVQQVITKAIEVSRRITEAFEAGRSYRYFGSRSGECRFDSGIKVDWSFGSGRICVGVYKSEADSFNFARNYYFYHCCHRPDYIGRKVRAFFGDRI